MRALRAQLAALFAALIIALPGSAWARAHFLCRMTGQEMPARCCKADHVEHASHEPQARPLDCCERIAPVAHTGALGTRLTAENIAPAALAALVPEAPYLPPHALAAARSPEQARAPPPSGPPLYLVHCAFLS
jgi:hypothetical protein